MTVILNAGSDVTVKLVKDPRPNVEYPAAVVRDDGNHVVVRAPWSGAPVKDLGFARFQNGDIFTEHYWRDRWYSIKEIIDANGAVKGWYCDVNRPAQVRIGVVEVADLYLDLWMSADRETILRLDEDEFDVSGFALEDPDSAVRARNALDELEHLARSGGFASLLDA